MGSARDSLRPRLTDVHRFPIFVSYGDEAKDLKATLKRLVEDVVNKQLSHADWPIELPIWDWRDIASQRAPQGGKTNDLFVEKARDSSATIVVLFDRLPPGTAEELQAVMGDDKVDLKVFWLNRRRRLRSLRGPTEVHQFLHHHQTISPT